MNSIDCQIRKLCVGLGLALSAISFNAHAVPYYYVDWQTENPAGGTASGVITPSSGPAVTVNFDALTASGAHGSFLGVTGNTLWNPVSTYQSAQVDNAPGYEGLQLVGGVNMTYTVTLSEAIKDPIMAIVSLGQGGLPTTYDFDSPFTIVSQGPSCCWGGTNTSLVQLPGNVLQGSTLPHAVVHVLRARMVPQGHQCQVNHRSLMGHRQALPRAGLAEEFDRLSQSATGRLHF